MLQALTAAAAQEQIENFSCRYVQHWIEWLRVSEGHDFRAGSTSIRIASKFKRIMGSWKACRPKRLRETIELQRTLDSITRPLLLLGLADLRCFQAPAQALVDGICGLWQIFEEGLCAGKATEVGVSKAILLVTKGRIGPAFDSNVKTKLKAWYVSDCNTYLKALADVARELAAFEAREANLEELAAQAGRPAAVGRALDMVFGPR